MNDTVDISLIIGIAATMVLSAFFSGMEMAFVTSNRMLFEMDKEKNGLANHLVNFFYRQGNDFVSTMLVGNNAVLVVYGILIARFCDNTIFQGSSPTVTVPADTIISTIIMLFTGEFLPKTLFRRNPNRLMIVFSPLAFLFYIVLWPISRIATFLSKMLLRIVGIHIEKEVGDEEFSKVDLDYLVNTSINNAKEGEEIEDEVKIFQNALEFSETKVRDCMVPRTEINAVEMNCPKDELMQKFVESGNSKIIVYREDIDHIEGYVHSSEMFKKSLGVVVDEFGGTSGIVALEDIVEEIFGDIEDEHDSNKYIAKAVGDSEYLLSARLEIDKVNEMFGIDLPESEEYKTIGGFILHHYQSFPKLNEVITIEHFQFKIVKSTLTKIELVRLKLL